MRWRGRLRREIVVIPSPHPARLRARALIYRHLELADTRSRRHAPDRCWKYVRRWGNVFHSQPWTISRWDVEFQASYIASGIINKSSHVSGISTSHTHTHIMQLKCFLGAEIKKDSFRFEYVRPVSLKHTTATTTITTTTTSTRPGSCTPTGCARSCPPSPPGCGARGAARPGPRRSPRSGWRSRCRPGTRCRTRG
jgi:hypothetical protein